MSTSNGRDLYNDTIHGGANDGDSRPGEKGDNTPPPAKKKPSIATGGELFNDGHGTKRSSVQSGRDLYQASRGTKGRITK